MATVRERVEYYIGRNLAPFSNELEQVLDDSVREVIGLLPLDSLTTLWEELTDTGSGVDTSNKFIVEVRKNLYRAQQISPSQRTTDAASSTQPLYYTWQGSTHVIPSGGTVLVVTPPHINSSDTVVANVPDSLMQLFFLRTAYNMLQVLASKETEGIEIDVVLPTAPTAPAVPSFAYSDATAATASATAIAALGTAPDYAKPVFSGSLSLPSLPTLDLETEIDGNPKSIPSAPAAPSFTYVNATSATTAATTLASLGSAPTYIKFSDPLDLTEYTSYETNEDPEMMQSIVARLNTEISERQTDIQNETADFQRQLAEYQQDAQHKIEQARTTLQEALADARSSTDVDVQNQLRSFEAQVQEYQSDLARYQTRLTEYTTDTQAQIEEYQAAFQNAFTTWREQQALYLQRYSQDIQNETNEFQKQLAAYQQDAQHKIEQARTTLQEALADARASTDVDVQNQLRQFEAQVQEYQSDLGKYQAQIQSYAQQVAAAIQKQGGDASATRAKVSLKDDERARVSRQYEVAVRAYKKQYTHRRPMTAWAHDY